MQLALTDTVLKKGYLGPGDQNPHLGGPFGPPKGGFGHPQDPSPGHFWALGTRKNRAFSGVFDPEMGLFCRPRDPFFGGSGYPFFMEERHVRRQIRVKGRFWGKCVIF